MRTDKTRNLQIDKSSRGPERFARFRKVRIYVNQAVTMLLPRQAE